MKLAVRLWSNSDSAHCSRRAGAIGHLALIVSLLTAPACIRAKPATGLAKSLAQENQIVPTLVPAELNASGAFVAWTRQGSQSADISHAISFELSDGDVDQELQILASSSNQDLLSDDGIQITQLNTKTGTISFSPKAGVSGITTLTLIVANSYRSTTQSFEIHVPPIHDVTVNESQPLNVDVTGKTIVGMRGAKSYSLPSTATPHGSVSLAAPSGSFVYTPSNQFSGNDSFDYVITTSGDGKTLEGRVNVTVNAVTPEPVTTPTPTPSAEPSPSTSPTQEPTTVPSVTVTSEPSPSPTFAANHAPVAADQYLHVTQGSALEVILSAIDQDASDSLQYSVVSQPAHGTLSGTAPNLVYTPNDNSPQAELHADWAPKWADLQGYWKLNETSSQNMGDGADFEDSSGKGNHAYGSGDLVYGLSARIGRAPSFNGTNTFISTPIQIDHFPTLSVSAWVKATGSGLIWGNDDGNFDRGLYCNMESEWMVWGGDRPLSTGIPCTSNSWIHTVVVYASDDTRFYLNGLLVYSSGTGATGYSGSEQFKIGRSDWSGGSAYFTGKIDEVALWSVPLTDNEVQTIYDRQSPNHVYSGPDSFTFKANDGTDDSNTGTVHINVYAPLSVTVSKSHLVSSETISYLISGGSGSYVVSADHGSIDNSNGSGVYAPATDQESDIIHVRDTVTGETNDISLNIQLALSVTFNSPSMNYNESIGYTVSRGSGNYYVWVDSGWNDNSGGSGTYYATDCFNCSVTLFVYDYNTGEQATAAILINDFPPLSCEWSGGYWDGSSCFSGGYQEYSCRSQDGQWDNDSCYWDGVAYSGYAEYSCVNSGKDWYNGTCYTNHDEYSCVSGGKDWYNGTCYANHDEYSCVSGGRYWAANQCYSSFDHYSCLNGGGYWSGNYCYSSSYEYSCLRGGGFYGLYARPSFSQSPVIQVSAGTSHSCALNASGQISCWGDNSYGQSNAPSGAGYTQVSAGWKHTCALNSAGQISCWGDSSWGLLNAPAGSGYIQVSVGYTGSCALSALGEITCWGSNWYGEGNAPSERGYTQISTGYTDSCALNAAGEIKCWGGNFYGMSNPPSGSGYVQVSTGIWGHACALNSAGMISCWGFNAYGQASPPSNSGYTQISSGGWHSCALNAAGQISCWGPNWYGQLSAPSGSDYNQIAAGHNHNCALNRSGRISCWESNGSGQSDPYGRCYSSLDEYSCLSGGGQWTATGCH